MAKPLISFGAGGENRTRTGLRPEDFESLNWIFEIFNKIKSLYFKWFQGLLLVSFGNMRKFLTLTGTR